MPSTLRFARAAALALLVAVPAGQARTVKADHDREADFSAFRTWAFGDSEWMQGLIESDRFLDGYIRAALRRELTAKGLREAPAGEADLLVTFEDTRSQRLDIDERHAGLPRRGRWRSSDVDVRWREESTLIVDLTDRSRDLLVWRGWLTDTVVEGRAREKRIDRGLTKLLRKYPPR